MQKPFAFFVKIFSRNSTVGVAKPVQELVAVPESPSKLVNGAHRKLTPRPATVASTKPRRVESTSTLQEPNEMTQDESPEVVKSDEDQNQKLTRSHSLDSVKIAIWQPDEYERRLLKQTWSDDFEFLYELGTAIYTYVFSQDPSLLPNLFPRIYQHGEKWKESKEFRSQALMFVQTLSHAVKNVYHMEETLAPHLVHIGELHVKYAQRGFKPEYWDCILDAMELSLQSHIASLNTLDDRERSDAFKTWRRLAHYIIVHMKRGFYQKLDEIAVAQINDTIMM